MKISILLATVLLLSACNSSSSRPGTTLLSTPEPVYFNGRYSGTNVLGVRYVLSISNQGGSVTGSMVDESGQETWAITGTATGTRFSGSMSKGAIYTFQFEGEALPGDVISLNPKEDLGLGDINFTRI